MKINAKIVLIVLFLIIGYTLDAKETPSTDYLEYVDEIVDGFVRQMEKKHNLHCYGNGGSMPNDVEQIEVLFSSYRKSTIEEARKMEVDAIQELLQRINSHEKIRPFLREYPFGTDRVGVTISFKTKSNTRPLDGSVAFVFLAKNKIFYEAAEIDIEEPTSITYTNEKHEVVKEFIEGYISDKLISLMNEPFEEALKIVGTSKHPNKE